MTCGKTTYRGWIGMVSVDRRPTGIIDRGWTGMVSVDRRPTGRIDTGWISMNLTGTNSALIIFSSSSLLQLIVLCQNVDTRALVGNFSINLIGTNSADLDLEMIHELSVGVRSALPRGKAQS